MIDSGLSVVAIITLMVEQVHVKVRQKEGDCKGNLHFRKEPARTPACAITPITPQLHILYTGYWQQARACLRDTVSIIRVIQRNTRNTA